MLELAFGIGAVVLIVIGAPIYIVLLAAAASITVFVLETPFIVLYQYVYSSLSKSALLAVPFFLFAGELMARGTLAEHLMRVADAGTRRVPGGMGVATVGASTFFGAISGSSVAAVGAIGRIAHDPLVRGGYPPRFAEAVIASSASIASVVPPSIAMILYSIAARESAADLFIAGILPGLVLAGALCLYVAIVRWRDISSAGAPSLLSAAYGAIPGFGMPVLVLGGIYAGIFSPTEAAGMACAYALLYVALIEKGFGLRQVVECAVEAALTTTQVLIIVAAGGVFAWAMTVSGVPQAIAGGLGELVLPGWIILVLIVLFLLAVGCVLDTASAILVLTPILLPVATLIGIDPIHFGVIMVLNLSIGMFTPPFGLNIFITQALFDPPIQELYRALLPFIGVAVLALLIITFTPDLSLVLLP